MVALTFSDYVDVPALIADLCQAVPVERTGSPLASTQGQLTYFTHRIAYVDELINALPAIVIDINDSVPVRYRYEGNSLRRGIPIVLSVLTPLYAYLEGHTGEQAQQDILTADTDIKQLVGDLEQVLNSDTARRQVGKDMEMMGATILFDELELQEATHFRARVAEITCIVWNWVGQH